MGQKNRVLLGDLGMLTVALIWGATNVVIRDALTGITPFWFCALRFMIALATLTFFFGPRALALPLRLKRSGIGIGTVSICSYIVAAFGLVYTTAGNQSFILSMPVVSVPVAVWALTGKFPGRHIVAAMLLCTAGVSGLMLDGSFSLNVGDVLTFGALLLLTAYILLVQKYVRDSDPYGLAFWQACGGALLALLAAILFEPFPVHVPPKAWAAVLYAATIGYALPLVLQNVAQKYTSATRAAIVLSMSSVFGSVLGVLFLNEPMTWRIFVASALILAGVVSVELLPALFPSKGNSEKT